MITHPDFRVLTQKEAADYMGVSLKTFKRMNRFKLVQPSKVLKGRGPRYLIYDLAKLKRKMAGLPRKKYTIKELVILLGEMKPTELLSISEFAKRVGVHRWTVHDWMDKGVIRPLIVAYKSNGKPIRKFTHYHVTLVKRLRAMLILDRRMRENKSKARLSMSAKKMKEAIREAMEELNEIEPYTRHWR